MDVKDFPIMGEIKKIEIRNLNILPEVAISVITRKLYCDFNDLHEAMETLIGRPVYTHELAKEEIWEQAKKNLINYYAEMYSANRKVK